jgi:type IV pilus assembly protein PilC
MGNWRWTGLDKNGKRSQGVIDASNEKEVRLLLRGQGIRPTKVHPPSILEFDITEFLVDRGLMVAFGNKELLAFTKQLAIMVNAGIPILQCLEILYKAEKNPVLKKAAKSIHREVGEGQSLAQAMEKQKGFSKLYCNLVKAGEAGGILDTILDKLANHMERHEKIISQVKSAMTYPAIVVLVGGGVIWALMVFVVPQFVGMLTDTGQEIPAITQFVIDASDFLQKYSLKALPAFFVLGVIFKNYVGTPSGKYIYDRLMMKMPVFGGIIIKGNLSAFARTLSTVLASGISLIDSLDICIDTLDNGVIAKDLGDVRKQVVAGKTLTEPLSKIDYFPEMVSQMIRVGEQTGNVDQMLEKVAIVFEDEVNQLIENMTKLMEPLIIVVLGGIIAVILVAMYLPMFMSAGGA